MTKRGRFIVLDGVDGCGKSTQAERLAQRLGPDTLHLREPGSTRVGENLRAMLLDGEARIDPRAETLLFASARRQLLDEVVAPALEAGRDVVCERFNGSTYAYQGVAGKVDGEAVLELLEQWCMDPAPDLELILDVKLETALLRRGTDADRIESRGLEYQRNVANGFRRYVDLFARVHAIDARGSVDDVSERIQAVLEGRETSDGSH